MSKKNKSPKGDAAPAQPELVRDEIPVLRPEKRKKADSNKATATGHADLLEEIKEMTDQHRKTLTEPCPTCAGEKSHQKHLVCPDCDGWGAKAPVLSFGGKPKLVVSEPEADTKLPFGFENRLDTAVDESIRHNSPTQQWKRWRDGLNNILAESKKLEEGLKYPSDIRAGWQKAASDNKLASCGLFDCPLHIIEKAEDDIKFAKNLAGIKSTSTLGIASTDPGYIDDLKGQVAALQKKLAQSEKTLEKKQRQVDTLTEVIAHLRTEATKAALNGDQPLPDRHLFGEDI